MLALPKILKKNKKKGIGGIWNKIKSFGGKKVGEPG